MSIENEIERLLRDQTLIALGVASRRPPYAVDEAGKMFVVDGPIRTWTKELTVSSSTEVLSTFDNGRDILIHHFVATCSDSAGLDAFRFAVVDQNNKELYVERDWSDSGVNGGAIRAPLASHILLSSMDQADTRYPLNYLVKSGVKRQIRLLNVNGTPSYTVSLTAHYQHLRPRS